ncbi:MAG: serine/threonine protein kinase [Verrucomicrobia bacterium]|nr:serine/threonine protein kinase [Verrucomicrobiota bacterium]MCH8512865.1 serine/threonine protein kinase [Kiritimatiellia bacterium]
MSKDFHIPGYTIVSKIAEGGMATVWKARQDKLDRVVAIKILIKDVDADKDDYQRFIYEARAAASLIHPNIVQVIDAGERDGFMYYIMEYVPGPTAGDVVSDGEPLPEERVLQIGLEVAEALDYAWRDHHVVHCDIKPDNLLLHRNGRTKVADLGLAQVTGLEGVKIDDDMTMGTPNYFSPEQALVEEDLDCRADMYALGATLYHLSTGHVPFEDLEPEEVASQQVHGQIPYPRDYNKKISHGMCCLIERLMAKDPLHRYEDWSGVMADIMAVKDGRLIKSPLASNIRSTITHKALPKAVLDKQNAQMVVSVRGGGIQRNASARRRRRSAPARRGTGTPVRRTGTGNGRAQGSEGIPIQRRPATKITAEQAAALYARRKPVQQTGGVWPLTIGLAIVVLFLYAFTFFRG